MYKRKIEFILSEGISTKLVYNPFYILRKGNTISNRTKKKRYLISEEIITDTQCLIRLKNIPKGIQYIYVSNTKKILLNSVKKIEINENFRLMIQIDPKCTYNFENYFIKSGTNAIVSKDIEDLKFNKNIKPFYYSNNEIIITKVMDERYNELINSSKKQNSIIYIGDAFTKFNLVNYFNVIDFEYTDLFLLQKLLTENIFFNNIKFIFVESGWLGKNNSWRKILTTNSNELRVLQNIAKSNNIKIIFMNKEDPYHFNVFTNVAKIADLIITTDDSCISKYKRICKAPIIVQSYFIDNTKYNPFYEKKISKEIFFAGAYYPKFKERTSFFEEISKVIKLDIYDRNIHNASINKMPKNLEKYIVGGALSQDELIIKSLEYKFALNLNSIVDEETMLARRVYENIALGIPQISNYSRAMSKLSEYEIITNEKDDIIEICNEVHKYEIDNKKLQKDALTILRKLSTYKLIETINKYKVCDITLPHDLCFEMAVHTESELISNIMNVSKFRLKTNIMFNFILATDFVKFNEELVNKLINNTSIYINYVNKDIPTINLEKNINIPINMVDDIYIASKSNALIDVNIEFNINGTKLFMRRSDTYKCTNIYLDYKIIFFNEIVPIVSNGYPSYSNIYQNGFIYSRVKDYANNNVFAPCFKLSTKFTNYEFEDTNCFESDVLTIIEILRLLNFKYFEVHFLDARMKDIIHSCSRKCIIFVHGYEAQNITKRRPFLIQEKDIELDKLKTLNKQKIFSEVITYENVYLNFVSNWQVEVFNEDINTLKLPFKYSINPNKIDMDKFSFKVKDFTKLKVLSLRPFASTVYANDITIGAILKLSEKDYFNEIEFTICGDGILYNEQTKELASKKFNNVKFINNFFSHEEIKALHDTHNIFVCPSRTDTQGVSRCEAMSSGLVTIGTSVDGVPEFNNKKSGYLIENNDIDELCSLIDSLYWDRRNLPEMSEAANEFIKEKCNYNILEANYFTKQFGKQQDMFIYGDEKNYVLKIENYDPHQPIIVNKDCVFTMQCHDDSLRYIKFSKENYADFANTNNKTTFHIRKNTKISINKGANVSFIPSIDDFDEFKFLDIYIKGGYLISSSGKACSINSTGYKVSDLLEHHGSYYISKSFKNGVHVTSNNDKLYKTVKKYSDKISVKSPCYVLINEESKIISIIISYELLERNKLDIFANTSEIEKKANIMNQAIYISLSEVENE